ncbi:oxidoreductase [Chromobacterium alticapitis]|uniref:Oxidoreductase n=2 Tax=Chromobacterium alticapitis TaxID=2073169 RepID=A0A2S5DKN0_9NEIS|nr:oxidoreductase [Chromobacterium alticapitis]POZ63643.1 oxidoreductase [Chromobacterium alticapitis]
MAKTLKAGLLGFGYAGSTFHAPLLLSVDGVELRAVASSKPERVHAMLPDVRVHASAEALLADPEIQLVVIATPNDSHYPLAEAALRAGKHVVVDKPFTLEAWQAKELIGLARSEQRLLSVFHNRRWDADFLAIKQLLGEGRLGRVVHFESHFDRYRPQVRQRWRESSAPGAGLWYDLGPHLLDQTLLLFGLPQAILLDKVGLRDGAQADDWFHAVLRYPDKRVILHGGTLVADVGPRFIVHGTEGSYSKYGLDPQEDALKEGVKPGGACWGRDEKPGRLLLTDRQPVAYAGPDGDYTRYYAGVRDAILRGAANPVPAVEAWQAMVLLELGRHSADQQSWQTVPASLAC